MFLLRLACFFFGVLISTGLIFLSIYTSKYLFGYNFGLSNIAGNSIVITVGIICFILSDSLIKIFKYIINKIGWPLHT